MYPVYHYIPTKLEAKNSGLYGGKAAQRAAQGRHIDKLTKVRLKKNRNQILSALK